MTPLDDARALFGADALTDRKQLRRAYARLVKAHPPETDAEMFQRVRAAFDAAKEALENPQAADADHGEALAALVDGLTEDGFEADLARLEAMAFDGRGAALTALFLVHATRPGEVLEWIAGLRQSGLPDDALLMVLTALLELRPDLGQAPICGALALTLPAPAAAMLYGHMVRASVRRDDPSAGFDLWRTHEAALRTYEPSTWLHVADAILFFAADRTPDDVLDGIEAAIEDVGLADDEQAHAELTIGLRQARTLARLQADPRIPQTMVDALRRGQRTSAPGMFSAVRQLREDLEALGAGSLSDGMQALAVTHPQAYEMLRELETRLTGSRDFHREWARTGAPPYAPNGATQPVFAALIKTFGKPRSDAAMSLKQAGLLTFCVLLGLSVMILGVHQDMPWWARMVCYAGVLGLYHGGRAVLARPAHPLPDWLRACADLQRTFGIWRHELMAGLLAEGAELPDGLIDALFDDDDGDIRYISAAHGFRSTLAWPPDADDPDADDSDADDAHAGEPQDPLTDLKEPPDVR